MNGMVWMHIKMELKGIDVHRYGYGIDGGMQKHLRLLRGMKWLLLLLEACLVVNVFLASRSMSR